MTNWILKIDNITNQPLPAFGHQLLSTSSGIVSGSHLILGNCKWNNWKGGVYWTF